MTAQSLVRTPADRLDGLVAVAAELMGEDCSTVRSLVDRLLVPPAGGLPERRGRSGLNGDGSPLELCISALPGTCLGRLIADPASCESDPLKRREAALAALEDAYDLTGSRPLRSLCQQILGILVGDDPAELRRYVDGVLWLGAGLGTPGLALYADATKTDPDESWRRAETCLAALLADSGEARRALPGLASAADLMAVGVEGTEPANARVKLFARLKRPLALAELGVDRFVDPALFDFLALLVDDGRSLPVSALVLSLAFRAATGELFDAKLDLCAHCLGYDPPEWEARLDRSTAALGLVPLPVHRLLAGGRAEVAFVGLNRNPLGSRLDLFLKPATWYAD